MYKSTTTGEWKGFNENWRNIYEVLDADGFKRLCECRSNLLDVAKMASLVSAFNRDANYKDCVDHMIEWCGDWNNQSKIADMKECQYNMVCSMTWDLIASQILTNKIELNIDGAVQRRIEALRKALA